MADTLLIKKTGHPSIDESSTLLDIAFNRALARESYISEGVLAMEGMSGRCYRMLINNLVRLTSQARYLEVGSWAGSTACSAIDKNVTKATCIDNWSQFGGPKETFLSNIASVQTADVDFTFIESDFRDVDIPTLGKYNIYLFDGPHTEKDQYDGLALYDKALDDDFIFIVDDWNWPDVRQGTFRAIRDAGLKIDFRIEIRTTLNDEHSALTMQHSDWHNGYFISKLSRSRL